MRFYTKKAVAIQAYCWRVDDCVDSGGNIITPGVTWSAGAGYICDTRGCSVPVMEGGWIIEHSPGVFSVCSGEEFSETYEPLLGPKEYK